MKNDVTINIPDESVLPAIEDALGNKPTPAFENPVGILGDIGVYLRYALPDGTLVFSDGQMLKVGPEAAAEIRKTWFADATRSRRQQIDLVIGLYRTRAEGALVPMRRAFALRARYVLTLRALVRTEAPAAEAAPPPIRVREAAGEA